MNYEVKLSPRAQRELNSFWGDTDLRLKSAVDKLANNPRPPGCRKMAGRANEWRIPAGVYRIVYTIDDSALQVLIRRVGHRRDVYDS